MSQGEGVCRRRLQGLPPPTRRRRLGIDHGDLVPRLDQGGQGRNGELRGAEKGDAHGAGLAAGEPPAKPGRELCTRAVR